MLDHQEDRDNHSDTNNTNPNNCNGGKVSLRFLGVGSASQSGLGHAAAVVEYKKKYLLIDCGPDTLQLFKDTYRCLPDAIFITHCHLDHIGDFENIFIQSWFHQPDRHQAKVFVPAKIIPLLHERVGSYPSPLAEGGVNFWDAFHLIPVGKDFAFNNLNFSVVNVRHHAPDTAYGLHLSEAFFYTGDTRPIPEVLNNMGKQELIFHDCSVIGNPSHTGIDDIRREYSPELIARMHFYHYSSAKDLAAFRQDNLQVVEPGQCFTFN